MTGTGTRRSRLRSGYGRCRLVWTLWIWRTTGCSETINRHTARCLVPSRWCAETFADSGVHVPIEVVPLGMDANDYAFVDRGGRDGPYTFLWNGTPDYRK